MIHYVVEGRGRAHVAFEDAFFDYEMNLMDSSLRSEGLHLLEIE